MHSLAWCATSLLPSVREVLLLQGVGATRRAAWASVTIWRHTVVVFLTVKFNPDSPKMGPLHKILLKLLCLCSLCGPPSLSFSFPFSPCCYVLFLGNYINIFASSLCGYFLCVQMPFLYIDMMVKITVILHAFLHRFVFSLGFFFL